MRRYLYRGKRSVGHAREIRCNDIVGFMLHNMRETTWGAVPIRGRHEHVIAASRRGYSRPCDLSVIRRLQCVPGEPRKEPRSRQVLQLSPTRGRISKL
jgi:hypothetical protein